MSVTNPFYLYEKAPLRPSSYNLIGCQDDVHNPITEETVIDVDERFLKFDSFEEFNKLCAEFNQKEFEYYKDWHDKQSEFVSLKYVYEKLVEGENKFLEELALKHGENAPLTRQDFGYTKQSQKFLDRGSVFIDDYELLDMNVSVPLYAYLVNADGIVQIDGKIYQLKKDKIKVIADGDASKIRLLNSTDTSIKELQIEVSEVVGTSKVVGDTGRKKANTTCTDTSDSYRLIAYEIVAGGPDQSHCGLGLHYYYRLRSLKKILGTWQNHKTNYLKIRSNNVVINHYKFPYNTEYDRNTYQVLNNLVNEVNVEHPLPYGHTADYYYFYNYYDCTLHQPTIVPESYCAAVYIWEAHVTAFGKNGSNCQLGAGTTNWQISSEYCHCPFPDPTGCEYAIYN